MSSSISNSNADGGYNVLCNHRVRYNRDSSYMLKATTKLRVKWIHEEWIVRNCSVDTYRVWGTSSVLS